MQNPLNAIIFPLCFKVVDFQEPEDVGPTILLGYFFLAWIILSIVLSAILSRS